MFAITGLIGSGKSFAASVIRDAGFDVLDADALVHELYKKDTELRRKIAEEFGDEAINENGINRDFVANLVFGNPQKLKSLESLAYPVLVAEIEKRKPDFVEAAVLYKCPELEKKMKQIWFIDTNENARMERIAQRRRGNPPWLPQIMQQQRRGTKFCAPTKTIENNGTKEQCEKKILELLNVPDTVQKNVSLKKYTTFKIGGSAKFFAEPKNIEEIRALLAWRKEFEIPYFVLGKGSNVLFDDYNGLVIKTGDSLHSLIQDAASKGLGGLEKLEGIPGTIGGAIFMNAGAHGQQISDCVKSVTSITEDGEIKTRTKEECEFAYRSSIFKLLKEIILCAEFDFTPMPKETIDKNRKEVLTWRKTKQPLQYPNAGSVFKNPAGHLSAGALIEACGLKGFSIGDAQISELHANFIVNKGNATAKDVRALMEKIVQSVWEVHGVKLEAEIFSIFQL
ncbi:MAG: UDP-N-acetylmuramate dehydrogenase [Fibromonadales bacterium]|nr:UDP-N-acetylmuramate dehydrogenase [Fibromonadales bacterium]